MIDPTPSSLAMALGAASMILATDLIAQTCMNPQHAYVGSVVTGSACGTNAFPELNHGTIETPGDDVVFKASGTYGVDSVTLTGDPHEMYVFVCSGCGVNAECVASAETDATGSTIVQYPRDGRDYYVIVDSLAAGCHDYSLTANGPLNADP